MLRNSTTRPGFVKSDSLFDGRAPVLGNPIVDAPPGGSVLKRDNILATLDSLSGTAGSRSWAL